MMHDAVTPKERANPERDGWLSRWLEERMLRQEILATESRLTSYEITAQVMADTIPHERGRLQQLRDRQRIRGFKTEYQHTDLSKLVTGLFLFGMTICILLAVAFHFWGR